MIYYCSADKETKYINSIKQLLAMHKSEGSVPAKQAASVLGKLQSLRISHGNIVIILPRNSYNELGKTVIKNDGNWNCRVTFCDGIKELEFLAKHLPYYNKKAITGCKEGSQTVYQKEVQEIIKQITDTDLPTENILISDASESKVFTLYHGNIIELLDYEFNTEEREYSSGRRELLGLIKFLENCVKMKREFPYKLLYWETDSSACYYFLTHGSRKSYIQRDVVKVKSFEKKLGITTVPIWTARSHLRIQLADAGSRTSFNSDRWGVPRIFLSTIFKYFQVKPDIDAFASEESKICSTYFSDSLDKSNAGINFFAQSLLSDKIYFMCPPVSLVGPTIRRIQNNDATCILLCLMWTSSPWWTLLHNGQHYHPMVKAVYIFESRPMLFHELKLDSIFNNSMKFIALLFKK